MAIVANRCLSPAPALVALVALLLVALPSSMAGDVEDRVKVGLPGVGSGSGAVGLEEGRQPSPSAVAFRGVGSGAAGNDDDRQETSASAVELLPPVRAEVPAAALLAEESEHIEEPKKDETMKEAKKPVASPSSAPPPAPAPPSDASFFVSLMLMGSVAFVMSLFYLLHYHDADVRTYSWNVVSTSICTFVGVLIGMSWNQCFVFFVVGPPAVAGMFKTIVCNCLASIGWYIMLQIVLAVASGAVGSTPADKVSTVLNLKCFAVLLGITNGASNLNLWGTVQTVVPHTFGGTVGVVLACFFSIGFMFMIGASCRHCISKGDDGKEDEYEILWDRFAKETEDGALCMTLAHLCVQATRLYITGSLPLPGGQMRPGKTPTEEDTWRLLSAGVVYSALIPIIDLCFQVKFLTRFKGWLKKIAAFSAAFCLLYTITWALSVLTNVGQPPGQMVLALSGTLIGFALIFLLDTLADMSCTGEATDLEIKAMVMPIATLIGFSWKQAFVGAITTITARSNELLPPPVLTLLCAFGLVLVVVPAWRLYILPTVMQEMVASEEKRQISMSKKPVSSLKDPLLDAGQGAVNALGPAAEVVPSGRPQDLVKQNAALVRRNADLEASIREIRQELTELKKLASILT